MFLNLVLTFLSSAAMAAGFSSGNNFSAISISGTLNLSCANGQNGETIDSVFNCHDSRLDPVMYDYFIGPQGIDADMVDLTVTRADGSVRNKAIKYDARAGKSREKFNLWESGLFSKALLADGNNKVVYKMLRANQFLTSGEFSVVVQRQAPTVCKPDHYTSTVPSDCQNQLTMCGKYFEAQNYCH